MRILRAFRGLFVMFLRVRFINIKGLFAHKRVAIVGAASSVFDEPRGKYIDGFDVVIRLNKAPYMLSPEKEAWLGSKTDLLFHSFYENDFSGGGRLDFDLYDRLGIQYVINPKYTFDAIRSVFNFYKKYFSRRSVYLPKRKVYKELGEKCKPYVPTMGLCALYYVLTSQCKECYITGFTFFRTSYADGYRDAMKTAEQSRAHIQSAGLHDPELEFTVFKDLYKSAKDRIEIFTDRQLAEILKQEGL